MVIMIFMTSSVCKLCNDQCDFSVANIHMVGCNVFVGVKSVLITIKIYCMGNW